MGSMLRYCRTFSVRALLVPALLALAWLVWGAGSAQASTDPSKAVVSESALDLGLSNVPSLPAAQVLRAGQGPAGSTAHHVATAANAVVGTTAPAVSTVTQVTDPVAFPVTRIAAPAVSAVSPAAAPVAATVNRTVAPLVSTLDHAVAAVDGPVASVTHRLPRLPRPAVKPPQLPNPDVPVATVRKPQPAVVSTVPRSPVADARRPVPAIRPGRFIRAGPQQFPQPRKLPTLLRLRRSPAQQPRPPPPRTWPRSKTLTPFKTLTQLKITASTRPWARAIQAPAQGPLHEHPATERLNTAATHGESGSSGSDSSGSHTADIAASWNGLSPAASALAAGAAVIPPSGPAADPGSSPD
jgi:hypothetical protein